MSVRISRKISFGPGNRGFQFTNRRDNVADQKVYDDGRVLEKERFREGSLGRKIYDRLSSRVTQR